MAYQLRTEKGIPIKRDGEDVLATNSLDVKIEGLDEKKKTFIAVASTEDEDRDKDIVRQDGWKLANFKKNPIIPWSHNYGGVPVAKSIKTWVDNDKKKGPRLLFIPKFDETDDDSMKIFNKYKNGFLNSFSVGFRGLKFEFRDEEDRWWGGREFLQQELLEISAVAVPANPNANTRLGITDESMMAMGYPEVFAKTKQGLFYPVTDIAVFTQPKEFEVDKGVIAINAVSMDEDIKSSDPVGYVFDSELFDDKTVNEWISANAPKSNTVKYFDLSIDEDNNIGLEAVTEESDIKVFQTSIDFSDNDISDKVSDQDIEIEIDDESKKEDDSEASETKVPDNADESDATTEPAIDDSNEGDDKTLDDNASDDKDLEVSDETVIPVKQVVEVITTIKDADGNVVDQMTETYASNKQFEDVQSFKDSRDNAVISLLQSTIDELKETIAEMSKQKTLANGTENLDNDDVSDDGTGKQVDSKNDDSVIELDESLLTPVSNDKTNSDEVIEIDEKLFDGTDSAVKEAVNVTLVEKLKSSLKEALSGASGKID